MNVRAEDAVWENGPDVDRIYQQGRWGLEHAVSMDGVHTGTGPYREPAQFPPLDQISVPKDEIRTIHRRDVAAGVQRFRLALIIGTLFAAGALGVIGGFQFLVFAPIPTAVEHNPNCSDHAFGSSETRCFTAKSDREAIRIVPKSQQTGDPVAMTVGRGHKTSASSPDEATAFINKVMLQQNAGLPRLGAAAIQYERSLPKSTPVPETRPGTIEGWTVLDVVGEMVVLKGPEGILRVTRGDTVPGLGKVNSIVRWGNRWIVATSKGLVSTP
jgi:hypothetical protein